MTNKNKILSLLLTSGMFMTILGLNTTLHTTESTKELQETLIKTGFGAMGLGTAGFFLTTRKKQNTR